MAKEKKTWRYLNSKCEAHTKSEARAIFKKWLAEAWMLTRKLKRLPVGAVIERI